ncbi:MAG: hypothetical protein RIR70_1464 [Pseudomonadota bacterium]|jgi:hypothetical protein
MKKMLVMIAAGAASFSALAAPTCNAPEEKWVSPTYFEAELQAQGYQVESLDISAGKCFELKGKDKAGKQVVVYFDPETTEVVDKK